MEKLREEVAEKRRLVELKRQKKSVQEWMQLDMGKYSEYDYQIRYVIPVTIGVGFEYVKDGHRHISVAPAKPREVVLDITSYRGVSPGAVHYYGKLQYWGAHFVRDDCPDMMYGWSGGDDMPIQCQSFKVELTRALTEKDFRDTYNRFDGYKVGDRQYTFNTVAEIKRRAKREFKRIFGPGWKYVDDNREDDYE